METTTDRTNGQTNAFNPNRSPLKLRPDQEARWSTFPVDQPLTFDQAVAIVNAARQKDGARADVGAGALDRLALVVAPEDGQLVVLKTEQVGTQLRPMGDPMPVRRTAFRQLCERADAPPEYISKIPAKLAHACLQYGLSQRDENKEKDGLLRLAGGELRAIVSSKYARLDDHMVLDAVDAALTKHGVRDVVRVRGLATGIGMTLRVTWPGEGVAVRSGDIIERGFDLLNGEVGNRSVGIAPCTFRLVCSNGMRRWTDGSRRLSHIGDPERLREAFVDALPVVINESKGLVDMMKVASERLIENLDLELGGLTQFSLTTGEAREVSRTVLAAHGVALPSDHKAWGPLLTERKDVTVYDVLNGVTAFAQTRTPDRRGEIEEVAGNYLATRTR